MIYTAQESNKRKLWKISFAKWCADITDIFVDSALKICGNDVAGFEKVLEKLTALFGDGAVVLK